MKVEEKKNFEKVDKITKIITIFICTCLGSIFLAACVYLLNMIHEEQTTNKISTNNKIKSVNLVNM